MEKRPIRTRTHAAADGLLIALFLVAISLPLVDRLVGLDASPELTEKRRLAQAPEVSFRWSALAALPAQVTAFWNDTFGFRPLLIRLHNRSTMRLGVSPSKSVIIGRRGWLFYTEEGSIDYYRGTRPFSQADLVRWQQILEARRDWLADRGIRYLFVIAPDKDTIYPEYMPSRISRLRTTTRLDQLIAHLHAYSDLEVLDLRQALLDAKGTDPIYRLTDTHWNDLGAFVAYREVMQRLAGWLPTGGPAPLSSFEPRRYPASGDLAGMLSLDGVLVEDWLDLLPRTPRRAHPQGAVPPGYGESRVQDTDDAGLPTAVMLHDSFGRNLVPLVAEHFRHIVFAWTLTVDPTLLRDERPDVVIQESAERFLMARPPSDSAELNDNARLRARFAASPDVRLRLAPGGTTSGIESDGRVSVLVPAAGSDIAVVLRAMDAAPSVLLPPFALGSGTLPVVRIDLTSPADTRLELFYESEGASGYDYSYGGMQRAQRNLWWPLRQGRNVLLMPLPDSAAHERLRLDLGKAPGDYLLHTLEVRGIPRASRGS